MLECRYEAGYPKKGKSVFVFQTANNRINKSDIRDYAWEYAEKFKKVRNFSKSLTTRTIPVFFYQRINGEKHEMYTRAEDMYEIFDRDVRAMKQGTLWIGDYYIKCYIIGSAKSEYDNGVIISEDVTVLSDFTWHKEVTRSFGVASGGSGVDYDFLDFSYDFEYDYGSVSGGNEAKQFASESISPFNFRAVIEAVDEDIEDPTLIVGGQIYRVFMTLHVGEHLVIDSVQKRVYQVLPDQTEINQFDARDRDNPIFAPMPAEGDDTQVVWQNGSSVELTAYIERSEPKWI